MDSGLSQRSRVVCPTQCASCCKGSSNQNNTGGGPTYPEPKYVDNNTTMAPPGMMYIPERGPPPATAPAAAAVPLPPWRQRRQAAMAANGAAAPAPVPFAPVPPPVPFAPAPAPVPFTPAPTRPTYQNQPPQTVQPTPSLSNSSDPVLQWISTRPGQGPAPITAPAPRAIPAHVASLEFAWSDVTVIKALGAGSFGKVFLAEVQHTPLAVKVLVDAKAVTAASIAVGSGGNQGSRNSRAAQAAMDADFAPTTATTEQLVKEVSALAPLRHPNVVALAGFCLEPPCLAMEYCSRGSLYDLLNAATSNFKQAAYLNWQRRLSMAADGAAGMLHLHTRSPAILHRDLKTSNLLVANDWTLKIAGVGLSKADNAAADANTVGGGTDPRFLAPEVLNGDNATTASDVFSFGICMWELLTWEKPYGSVTVWKIVGKIMQGERPPLPPLQDLPGFGAQRPAQQVLDAYIGLMNRCWAQDPRGRPTFDVVASELRALLRAETEG